MKKPFKETRWYKYLRPFASWRFLISFGFAWMLTNGVWYMIAFAPLGLPGWLVWLARGYITILYGPTPEKLITLPIAIWVHLRLFRYDHKTHKQLEEMHLQAKNDWESFKLKFKRRNK